MSPHAAKVLEYLTRFADKAALRYAHIEVLRALQTALDDILEMPARRCDMIRAMIAPDAASFHDT